MSAQIAWKIAKVLIPFVIGAIMGGIVVGKAKQLQMDAVKLELAKTQQELTVCQDANQAGQATIGSLKTELQSAQKSCTTRLRQKERTAGELKRIDGLKPGVKANETNSNTGSDATGDPILDALNGMFIDEGRPTDRED